jgi:hypothetical protein
MAQFLDLVNSLAKIQGFLEADEINSDHIKEIGPNAKNAIEIFRGRFYWLKDKFKDPTEMTEESSKNIRLSIIN